MTYEHKRDIYRARPGRFEREVFEPLEPHELRDVLQEIQGGSYAKSLSRRK